MKRNKNLQNKFHDSRKKMSEKVVPLKKIYTRKIKHKNIEDEEQL